MDNASQPPPKSLSLVAIYLLIAVCAVWALLLPWVPAVAEASMRRFHLTSGSFAAWAIQQPIPAMYNFENTYEIRQWPPSVASDLLLAPILDSPVGQSQDFGTIHSGHINHFPARVVTFSSHRFICCDESEDRWVVTISNYRGQRVETLTELKSLGDGHFNVTRTDVKAR